MKSLGRAVPTAAVLIVVVAIALLGWGLVSGNDLHVPLFLDVDSEQKAGGEPQTTLSFSPIGPLLGLVILSLLLWPVFRARSRATADGDDS
ncbi:hypothetical protein [Kribbella sp. CA-293567]|uniref:hypothetical protein n=1 Tax=Kribbella sp. CA-293567 TaxID=3002436 RepID=UPI0022DD0910|nr:hypothetical protein [Kribbella sp. CA-293567]WBQ04205.1 hypothetical protein OX958_30085 [Kribbella sp. CA-293567]